MAILQKKLSSINMLKDLQNIAIMNKYLIILLLSIPAYASAQYNGTASVSQGKATTTVNNLYTCDGGRKAGVGIIKSTDNIDWTVPALTNFTNLSFPIAPDLHNICVGANNANVMEALSTLTDDDIVTINPDGEVITAYVFADNYFEMYINGVAVGKDAVPFTQFNSSIVRFKVNRPFTIAMLLVDWEENLGLGSELNGGFAYHPGDGGMVAVFKDSSDKTVAITNKSWKAQTFYTSPIIDLKCPEESGTTRLSNKCSTQDSNNGSTYYALHWKRPEDFMMPTFDDSLWPAANEYTNSTIGVNNKLAYTNFTNIFDDPISDAQFIWSTNIILDNEVVVRYNVPALSSVPLGAQIKSDLQIYPNPATNHISIKLPEYINKENIKGMELYNSIGKKVKFVDTFEEDVDLNGLVKGFYTLQLNIGSTCIQQKFIIQ